MQQLPETTNKQLDLLLYLYKFNFLNTNQFQKLFKHKEPQTVQAWLKNLKDKQYITVLNFDSNKFIANTKPAIYSLTKLARRKLKTQPKCEVEVLNRVYRAKSVSDGFIYKCIFLADIYLNLLSQMEGQEKLHFSTHANLKGFDYFPVPIPDAFIAIKKPTKTKRYFLILLDARIPWYILDRRVRKYVEYTDDNNWTDFSPDPLPTFLIICPNESTMKHVYNFIRNNMPDKPFYLAIRDTIRQSGFKGDVWQKVEPQDE